MLLPEDRYQFSSKKRRSFSVKKLLLIVVVAAIAGGVLFFVYQKGVFDQSESTDLTTNALYELWESRQYSGLISRCEDVLQNNPMDAEALVFSGFSYFYEGVAKYSLEEKIDYFNEAVRKLRKAELIENRPYPGGIKYILGKTYYHKGRFYMDQAIEYLEASIEAGYIGNDTHEYLGLAYSALEKYERGIDHFLKAAEKNPSDILFLTIAQTYYKMHDMDAAEEYLLRAINKTEDLTIEEKARFLLGQIFIEKDELLKAEDQYKAILEDNPESADAHFHLGEIYEEMGDTIKARAEWRKTLRIDSSHYGARLKYYD
jgi:tetratricopeptide (TPR) repeat protein